MPQTTETAWWADRTAYQVYPRSFCDANGDGIGDIPGIISRLDYLADLGIGILWLSPVYRSPMADNGYDISDYRDIAPEFGTLDDFDRLVAEAARRDIRIVMDLVVNHSSNEHAWFKAARARRDAPTRDFYIWRDPAPGGGPPTDRQSFFGGPAWTFTPETGQYYLHLFTPEQPDLNWDNPTLRAEIYDMMNWWLDRGIGGFRMDVIDLIGKDIAAGQVEEGPRLHDWLQEMHAETLAGRDVVTIGESWNVTTETALLYCGRARKELSMVFQFEHIMNGWDAVHGKWRPKPFDLPAFKEVWTRWQETLADDGWNALFLSNHDLPRQVSRYGDESPAAAKALATAMHMMKGTPFIFQGEELGMTNARRSHISAFRDVETLNLYAEETARGMSPEAFIAGANANGRDNARTPMQWTAGPNAGFTDGTPWIDVNPNHVTINAAAQADDPDSVLAHYRHLVALRRAHPVIVDGRYTPYLADHEQVMAYTRTTASARLAVLVNLGATPATVALPAEMHGTGTALVATGPARAALGPEVTLAPWESVAFLLG